jgi:hypothetical protein
MPTHLNFFSIQTRPPIQRLLRPDLGQPTPARPHTVSFQCVPHGRNLWSHSQSFSIPIQALPPTKLARNNAGLICYPSRRRITSKALHATGVAKTDHWSGPHVEVEIVAHYGTIGSGNLRFIDPKRQLLRAKRRSRLFKSISVLESSGIRSRGFFLPKTPS